MLRIRTVIVRISRYLAILLRVLDHTFTIFVDLEIKGEFPANTYRSAILFFTRHKFPLFDSSDYGIANAFGRRLEHRRADHIAVGVILQLDHGHALFLFLEGISWIRRH